MKVSIKAHRESKKGATVTMAVTLSIFDGFAKFFYCSKSRIRLLTYGRANNI